MVEIAKDVLAMCADDRTQAGAHVWGLSAQELHDAYWSAHGVQCVRRGQSENIQREAKVFLLVESGQLVLINRVALAVQMRWGAAVVTRVCVDGLDDEAYGEEVEIDQDKRVVRIARRYGPRRNAAHRVLLTRWPRIACAWARGERRLGPWKRIRRLAGPSDIETVRSEGACFTVGSRDDERRLIDRLVETWPRPDRAIDGIVKVREGVWGPRDSVLPENAVAVGPVWIGHSGVVRNGVGFVGPLWVGDDVSRAELNGGAARVRLIRDIEPGDGAPETKPQSSSRPWYNVAKRTQDITVGMLVPVLMMPLLVLVAIAILVEDGRPMFYGHLRQTRGGRTFRCWKFRTMYRDADLRKQRLTQQNEADGPHFVMENDPRVTRVGRVLRACCLDELPQLWNVLLGHMSLVGPRPSPDNENQICPTWRELRLSVRPGLTGLWQLERTREPDADFQEWIRYDLEYIVRAGFLYDATLLLRTVWTVLRGASKVFGRPLGAP